MSNFTGILGVLLVMFVLLAAALVVEGYHLLVQFLASFGV